MISTFISDGDKNSVIECWFLKMIKNIYLKKQSAYILKL